jgi:hypothetical protein
MVPAQTSYSSDKGAVVQGEEAINHKHSFIVGWFGEDPGLQMPATTTESHILSYRLVDGPHLKTPHSLYPICLPSVNNMGVLN